MKELLSLWDGQVGVSDGVRGGGGDSHAAASPSFLVLT